MPNSTAAPTCGTWATPASVTASGSNSQAIGSGATASGVSSYAGGNAATASGSNSVALGSNSNAVAASSTVLGTNAVVNAGATNSVAVGNGATVLPGVQNSVALGNGSVADAPNTVSVGTTSNPRRIVNVQNGILPNDAVNVSQLNAAVHTLQRGIATSMAMGNIITPSAPGKTTVGFNTATYAGYYSAAINFAHRVNTETPVYVTGAIGGGESGAWGGRVGVAVEF